MTIVLRFKQILNIEKRNFWEKLFPLLSPIQTVNKVYVINLSTLEIKLLNESLRFVKAEKYIYKCDEIGRKF